MDQFNDYSVALSFFNIGSCMNVKGISRHKDELSRVLHAVLPNGSRYYGIVYSPQCISDDVLSVYLLIGFQSESIFINWIELIFDKYSTVNFNSIYKMWLRNGQQYLYNAWTSRATAPRKFTELYNNDEYMNVGRSPIQYFDSTKIDSTSPFGKWYNGPPDIIGFLREVKSDIEAQIGKNDQSEKIISGNVCK